jgi:hypothetical protein
MDDGTRNGANATDAKVVDEVWQDECWKSEVVGALLQNLASEQRVWNRPAATIDWIDAANSALKSVIILIAIVLYHVYFH